MRKQLLTIALAVAGGLSVVAATPASYPGGEKALQEYLSTNIRYPAAAKENSIEGVVDVSFTVRTDGTVGTIKIVRMVDPDLEQEAIRLVKSMPAWIPATDDAGHKVDSNVTVPVSFSLGD